MKQYLLALNTPEGLNINLMEDKHHEESNLLAVVTNAINCMVVILDKSGIIIYCNDSCKLLSGKTSFQARGKYYWDLFCQPDEINIYKEFFSSLSKDKLPFTIEARVTGYDDTTYDLAWHYSIANPHDNDKPLFVLTGTDLTLQNNNSGALAETEELYRALIHAAPTAVITLDPDLKITSWSSSAEDTFGWTEKEVLGRDAALFLDRNNTTFSVYSSASLRGKSFCDIEYACKNKTDQAIILKISLSPLRSSRGSITGLIFLAADITEHKNYEDKFKHLSLHDQLTGLYNRTYFDGALSRLRNQDYYPLTIIAVDLDGLKVINDSLGHEEGDIILTDCAKLLTNTAIDNAVVSRVGGDEFAIILPNTDAASGSGVRDDINAAIEAYNRDSKTMPLSISMGLATADENIISPLELFREADDMLYLGKQQTGAGAKSQIIMSLMAALDERDLMTAGHGRRLEKYCKKIGIILKLPQKNLHQLLLLSRVHDIGKVGIPDSILYKNGPLSEEEWKDMRRHPEKGHRIASASADLCGIADLIIKHHEHWDGSGYPLGLKGEDIPIECRILAVVDAFDAMTHERPYKKPIDHTSALKELKENAGSQFDPRIVKIFIELLSS